MSDEQLKAFLEKLKGSTSLQDKLRAAKSPDDVAGIAKEHGYEITAEQMSQLNESELENLAGGIPGNTAWGGCKPDTNICTAAVECS